MTGATELAARFARIAEELAGAADEAAVFDCVVTLAPTAVPGCDQAGLTLRTRRGRVESVATSGPVATTVDELQHELDEGPCVDAARRHETVVVADLQGEERWPRWTPAAVAHGLRSVHAAPFCVDGEPAGALNLYGRQPEAFDHEPASSLAAIYGSHAATALQGARLAAGLRVALESRHAIGMAQGMLASEYGITVEAAFDVLHRYSNETNTRLRDVAQRVVDGRGLPARDGWHEPAGYRRA